MHISGSFSIRVLYFLSPNRIQVLTLLGICKWLEQGMHHSCFRHWVDRMRRQLESRPRLYIQRETETSDIRSAIRIVRM